MRRCSDKYTSQLSPMKIKWAAVTLASTATHQFRQATHKKHFHFSLSDLISFWIESVFLVFFCFFYFSWGKWWENGEYPAIMGMWYGKRLGYECERAKKKCNLACQFGEVTYHSLPSLYKYSWTEIFCISVLNTFSSFVSGDTSTAFGAHS